MPEPNISALIPQNHNLASAFYDRLISYIVKFEKNLNESEEVGARLVSFGESVIIHIDDLGYHNPSLISFDGFNSKKERVQLIQHVSQISVLLVAVKREDKTKQRIGYKLTHQEE